MSIKIAWIDDEIQLLSMGLETLKMKGHEVVTFDNTHDFLQYLEKASSDQVDVFILDLMMKIEEEDYAKLTGRDDTSLPDGVDTGIYMYNEIRKKFPGKPVVIFTIVRRPLPSGMTDDENLALIHKGPRIMPVLKIAMELVERK